MKVGKYAFLSLTVLLAGCLYPSLPDDPMRLPDDAAKQGTARQWLNSMEGSFSGGCKFSSDPLMGNPIDDANRIKPDYECALDYAKRTRDTYRKFLINNARVTESFGLLMLAAGGAALGVNAAGTSADSTLVIQELGIGGGTALGAALWTQNKPKLNAYGIGISAVQCVLDQSGQFAPAVDHYAAIDTQAHALQADYPNLVSLLSDIQTLGQSINADIGPLPKDSEDQKTCNEQLTIVSNLQTSMSSNKAAAEQALGAAQKVLSSAQDIGPTIVLQVQSIDAQVFNAAYKGEPDLASISGLTRPVLPFSGVTANAPAAPSNGADTVIHGGERPLSCLNHSNATRLASAQSALDKVSQETNALTNLLATTAAAPPDFSKCITSVSQLVQQAQAAQSQAAQTQPALQIALLPGFTRDKNQNTSGQIIVTGGTQPYTPSNDPKLTVSMVSQSPTYAIFSVTLSDTTAHTLTITDAAKTPQQITITPVQNQV